MSERKLSIVKNRYSKPYVCSIFGHSEILLQKCVKYFNDLALHGKVLFASGPGQKLILVDLGHFLWKEGVESRKAGS